MCDNAVDFVFISFFFFEKLKQCCMCVRTDVLFSPSKVECRFRQLVLVRLACTKANPASVDCSIKHKLNMW